MKKNTENIFFMNMRGLKKPTGLTYSRKERQVYNLIIKNFIKGLARFFEIKYNLC